MDTPTFRSIVSRWNSVLADLDVLNSATAVSVLGELSVGGSLMRGAQQDSAIRKNCFLNHCSIGVVSPITSGSLYVDLSNELQKELREIYHSFGEITRHFWAAFPPSTPQLMEKASRMVDTLLLFDQVRLPLPTFICWLAANLFALFYLFIFFCLHRAEKDFRIRTEAQP